MAIAPTMHVVFTGGGTGGHVFPGLAVAEHLVADAPRTRITFAGGGKAWERRAVAAAGFDYIQVRCRPFPRRPRDLLPFLIENVAGYRSAVRYLGWHRVAVVVGLGGYASVPMARAAVRARVPLLLLEQNVVPGRATRWLASSATMVCTAFEQTVGLLGRKCAARVTGNPIRQDFVRPSGGDLRDSKRLFHGAHHPPGQKGQGVTAVGCETAAATDGPEGRAQKLVHHPAHPSPLTPHPSTFRQLLVLGGSSGARSLNENVPRALCRLGQRLAGWRIVHQSGEADFDATRRLYAVAGLLGRQAEVHPFLTDMPQVLAQSDLAVSRAGGTTLAELAAAGVPAVLLPYPFATDDHQRKNADVFTAAGGALVLDERELGTQLEQHLAATLAKLVSDDARRAKMSEAIRRRAHPDATWDVATMIRHLA